MQQVWQSWENVSLFCLDVYQELFVLVVQWLRLWLPMQRARVWSLVRKLRSYMPRDMAKNWKIKLKIFKIKLIGSCCVAQGTLLSVLYRKWKWRCSVMSRLFAIPWTVAYQAPPSMGFSRQEYWSGLPFPSPGGLPKPGIEPWSPALQTDALLSEPPGKPVLYRGGKNLNESGYICACGWFALLHTSN